MHLLIGGSIGFIMRLKTLFGAVSCSVFAAMGLNCFTQCTGMLCICFALPSRLVSTVPLTTGRHLGTAG